MNNDLDLCHLSILELFGWDLDNTIPVNLGDLVGTTILGTDVITMVNNDILL